MFGALYDRLCARPRYALAVAAAVLVGVELIGIGDYPASDPLWYAQIADHVARAPREALGALTNHPFDMRIGLTLPLALLYRVFGVSPLVTTLPTMLSGLLVLVIVYAAAPTPRAKLIGLGIAVTSLALVAHAVVLEVDVPCAALVGASILCLSRRERARGAAWIAAAIACWFAAFLVKETALWCIPLWLVVVWLDVRAHGLAIVRRYLPGVVLGVILAGGYLALCAAVWGDPLARFAGIQALTGEHNWSMVDRPASDWLARLAWGPPVLFGRLFLTTLMPVALAPFVVRDRDRIWWIAAFVLLGMFWFGSTSLTAYAPLPLIPRMAILALPALLVTATLATDRLLDRVPRAGWRTAVLGAIVVPNAIALALFLARPRPESHALAHVISVAETRPVVLVCADPRGPALASFYAGFAPRAQLDITFAPTFASAPPRAGTTVFVLVNTRRPLAAEWWDPAKDPRGYRLSKITDLHLPSVIAQPPVTLYDAGDGSALWRALQ